MAGNLPINSGVELKMVWGLSGNPHALNILHFTQPAGTTHTQARADSIASAVRTALTGSGVLPLTSALYSLLRVESRQMTNDSDPWFTGSGAAVPGTSAGKPLPAATSFVVTLKTGLRGRSYNGRVYLAGWADNANDAAGGATAATKTAAEAFITQISIGVQPAPLGLQMCVLSRFTTNKLTSTVEERNPPIMTPVTLAVANDLRWDSQRRRAVPGI